MAFNVNVAARVAGLSLRQVRYWDHVGLLEPSVQAARGRGSRRLYSFDDLVELRIIAMLRSSGISLQRIAKVIRFVQRSFEKSGKPLQGVTLLTDGKTVFVRSDDRDKWADALRMGQIVWLVPVADAWRETEAVVAELSAARCESVAVGGRKFEVVLEPDLEVGGWVVECKALPGCVSEGRTLPEARRMIRDAIKGWLAVDAERPATGTRRRRAV